MQQLIAKLFYQRTVLVLQVQGRIDSYLVNKLSHQLENYNKGSLVALALVINSEGGCQYQVEALSKKVMRFASSFPLYTFTTDQALGNAYQILSLGNKIYAQNSSKLGFTSFNRNQFKFGNCLRNYGIDISCLSSSKLPNHSYLFTTHIQESTEEQQKYMNSYLESKSQYLSQECVKAKGTVGQIGKEQLQQTIFLGEEAKKYNLIDGIGTFEKILIEHFPKARITPTSIEGKLSEYEKWFNLFIKVTQSRGFLGLMMLFATKVMIKWGLIIYVWRQSVKQQKQKRLQQQAELLS